MFVVAKELVGIPGLPATPKGIREALGRLSAGNQSLFRRREGTKAIEYHVDCLPKDARELVKHRFFSKAVESADNCHPSTPVSVAVKAKQELALMQQCPALARREADSLTEQQRKIADARCVMVMEVDRLRAMGETRASAVAFISSELRAGFKIERLQQAVELANARK